ncbi:MAG: hypothetical protein RDU83_07460 [bacterium]|nr:hypothetical protein [bacterium]
MQVWRDEFVAGHRELKGKPLAFEEHRLKEAEHKIGDLMMESEARRAVARNGTLDPSQEAVEVSEQTGVALARVCRTLAAPRSTTYARRGRALESCGALPDRVPQGPGRRPSMMSCWR